MQNSDKYLAVVDIDRTQSYIFATDRLREIAGASALLDDINRIQIRTLFNKNNDQEKDLLVCSGGVTKALFSDQDEAEAFARKASSLYLEKTGMATATWHVEPVNGSFKDANQRAEHRIKTLKSAKNLKRDTGTFQKNYIIFSPFLKRCQVCGLQPVSKKNKIGNEIEYTCFTCKAKADARKKDLAFLDKEGIHREIQIALGHFKYRDGNLLPVEDIIPDDFGDIKMKTGPTGEKSFIGLVLADGNSIGDHIKNHLDTPEKLKNFSTSLEHLTRKSLLETVKECYKDYEWVAGGGMSRLPLRVLLLGGDDLLIVTPGEMALPLALGICEKFQELSLTEKFQEPLNLTKGNPLTLSAGIAIGKFKHPFFDFVHLAESLLSSAKQKGRSVSQDGIPTPVLDFSAIRWSGRSSLKHFRENQLRYQNFSGTYQMTSKPFTLDEFKALVKDVEYIRDNVPRSKYKALSALCSYEKDTKVMQTNLENWKDTALEESVNLKSLFPRGKLWVRNEKKGQWETRVLDGQELIDFWPKKNT